MLVVPLDSAVKDSPVMSPLQEIAPMVGSSSSSLFWTVAPICVTAADE